jgi:hypothetical protein
MKMKTYWVLGMAMAAGLLSAHAEECTVNVYVRAGFTWGAMLQRAKIQTVAMFREIGVEVRFRNGDGRPAAADGACGMPIVLEIDPQADEQRASEHALAHAMPYSKSGACIQVFMNRIATGRNPYFETVLLAHVLTHEITHVLEQITRHSPDGIMKAKWDSRDKERMQSHPLPFAAIDVELIHAGIAKRIQEAVTE